MKSCCLYIILFLAFLTVKGQTIIPGGYVSGTWISSQSPIHVQGNIEVHYDSTLMIEPGVEVYFDGSYKLTVHGRLDASGTAGDSILFTANDISIGWKGIDFYQINETLDSSYLRYCIIKSTIEYYYLEDAAIYIYQADKILINHCCIANNMGFYCGGVMLEEANIQFIHSLISKNRATNGGAGGVYCINSVPNLFDLKITGNESPVVGGLYYRTSPNGYLPVIKQIEISKNIGGIIGGLEIKNSNNIKLEDCKICYNTGDLCGGIGFFGNSALISPVTNRKNNVFMNKGGKTHELYCDERQNIEISIDTFSVWNPDEYHVFPKNQFHFTGGIQYGFLEPVDTNLYISPNGSDSNDGFSPEHALRSFDYALRKIESDLLNKNTIWVLPGHYHLSESDSCSAIFLKEHVIIAASATNEVFIDGDSATRIITAWNKKDLKISGLTLQNGSTRSRGGAVYLNSSHAIIESCNLISNYAFNGGGACIEDPSSKVIFNSCKFLSNSSIHDGGGIEIYEIGIDGVVEFNDCDFVENSSGYWGGGLRNEGSMTLLYNCQFISNHALVCGGGACILSPNVPNIINCSFIHNDAGDDGGGLSLGDYTNHDYVHGYLTNCTFSDNTAVSGTAISMNEFNELIISNSIFWNTTIPYDHLITLYDYYYTDSTTLEIDHSVIQGGESSVFLHGSRTRLGWEEGNISINPEFIDPANSDYSLNWNSPCIEAGKEDTTGLNLPETDLNGDPRIVNARIDMGAYEYQLPVSFFTFQPKISNISIYYDLPNKDLIIEFPIDISDKSLSIRLISMEGMEITAEVKPQGTASINLPVPEISTGIYLVSISDSRKILLSRKVMIFN
jgi:hypothetical protein